MRTYSYTKYIIRKGSQQIEYGLLQEGYKLRAKVFREVKIFPLTWQLLAAETGECPPQALLSAPRIQSRTRYGNRRFKFKNSISLSKMVVETRGFSRIVQKFKN